MEPRCTLPVGEGANRVRAGVLGTFFPRGGAACGVCFEKSRLWHELQIQPNVPLELAGLIALPSDDKGFSVKVPSHQ